MTGKMQDLVTDDCEWIHRDRNCWSRFLFLSSIMGQSCDWFETEIDALKDADKERVKLRKTCTDVVSRHKYRH